MKLAGRSPSHCVTRSAARRAARRTSLPPSARPVRGRRARASRCRRSRTSTRRPGGGERARTRPVRSRRDRNERHARRATESRTLSDAVAGIRVGHGSPLKRSERLSRYAREPPTAIRPAAAAIVDATRRQANGSSATCARRCRTRRPAHAPDPDLHRARGQRLRRQVGHEPGRRHRSGHIRDTWPFRTSSGALPRPLAVFLMSLTTSSAADGARSGIPGPDVPAQPRSPGRAARPRRGLGSSRASSTGARIAATTGMCADSPTGGATSPHGRARRSSVFGGQDEARSGESSIVFAAIS